MCPPSQMNMSALDAPRLPALSGSSDALCSPGFWEQRHAQAANNFCQMLLRIRSEGAQKFQDGMWGIWQTAEALHPLNGTEDVDPTCSALSACYHVMADLQPMPTLKQPLDPANHPYVAVSQRWLLSFEAMARQLKDEHDGIFEEKGLQSIAMKKLVGALAKGLDKPGTRAIRVRKSIGGLHGSRTTKMLPLGLSRTTAEELPDLQQFQGAWAVLPLVWLPLALYVRSTTHLYELLDRMHRLQVRAKEGSAGMSGPNAEDEVRAILDRDQRRYSYLVFAITAALQTLILAKKRAWKVIPILATC